MTVALIHIYLRKKLVLHFVKGVMLLVAFTVSANPKDLNEIKTDLTIRKQSYCIDPSPILKNDPKTNKLIKIANNSLILDFDWELTIKNVGLEALIIQKDYFAVSRLVIAKDIRSLKNNKFIHDTSTLLSPQFSILDDKLPPNQKFVVLKPNESFSTLKQGSMEIDKQILTNKNKLFYIGLVVYIWGGQSWAEEKQRTRWKEFGYLWTSPVSFGPSVIYIKKPKSIAKCS